ncbi:MAG: metallophosphoesterase [Prevotella sp.]
MFCRSLLVLLFCLPLMTLAQNASVWKTYKRDINFIVANDLGRNGYYDQKPIAELMGEMSGAIGTSCVVAPGDIHHFYGVRSVNDPLWTTNYELIYSHPDLMLPWYPALGNHEYRGNTQAVLDYTNVSRRWCMPARYYTKVLREGNVSLRLILLDTSPMINRYREESDVYPDACHQDVKAQLDWLDTTLANAQEDWVLVFGHHPVYADTPKSESERTDMQHTLLPVLHKYRNKVAMYICGHIHNFQHIRMKGDPIDYVVNTSASLSRPKVKAIEGTVFCSGADGFSIVNVDKQHLTLRMIDGKGQVIHTIDRTRK